MNYDNNDNTNALAGVDADSDDSAITYGSDEFGMGADSLGSFSSGRKLPTGTILVVGVVLFAALGLFSMRTLTQVTAASAGGSELDKKIGEFLSGLRSSDDMDVQASLMGKGREVIDVLSDDYSERQVPLSDVQRNPFILYGEERATGPEVTEDRTTLSEEMWKRNRQTKLAVFEGATNRVKVSSIMMGATPLANINNQIVQAGAVISIKPEGIEFTVTKITHEAVELQATDRAFDIDQTYTVKLDRETP